jgi:para-nitrobenzyl esterase
MPGMSNQTPSEKAAAAIAGRRLRPMFIGRLARWSRRLQVWRAMPLLRAMSVWFALVAAIVQAGPVAAAIDGPVRVETGLLLPAPHAGAGRMREFKGIPYAAAPEGALRWRPPSPAQPWQGIRHADQFGPPCFQGNFPGVSDPRLASEDCLSLNIWTPAAGVDDRLPVMFWIHGGAYIAGSNARIDGAALAAKGVVVVAINYRLGLLGFFAHPDLTAQSPHHSSGDYGLLDVVAALTWVQHNIAAFGGDPGNVTIFGQSAGAEIVSILTVAPAARGLFQRAIAESGGSLGWREPKTLDTAQEEGMRFAARAGARSLAQLRQMSAAELYKLRPDRFEPVVDGSVYPLRLHDVYAQGKEADVPMIIGSNGDEGQWSPTLTMAGYVGQVRALYGARTKDFLARFPASTDLEARRSSKKSRTLETQYIASQIAIMHARTLTSPVYQYRFIHAPPPSVTQPEYYNKRQGAYHAAELVYVFANLEADPRAWSPTDRRLEALLSSYWVNFARTGDPNGAGLPHWPSVQNAPDEVMQFDRDALPVHRNDTASQRFFEDIYYGPGGALAGTAASAVAAPVATRGDQHLSYYFGAGNKQEPYRIYVPGSYDGSRPYPLVVVLHGSGSDENDPFERSDLRRIAEQRGYILLCPLGYSAFGGYGDFYPVVVTREMRAAQDTVRKLAEAGAKKYPPSALPVESPAAPDDYAEMPAANLVDPHTATLSEADVMSVLEHIRETYRIDSSRIYLMGNSMGGVGTLYLGARYPEIWAGLAPSGGPIAAWSYPYERLRQGHVALLLVHGDRDAHSNPLASRAILVAALAQQVDASILIVKDGDHAHAWTQVLAQTFDFFDRHRKP